MEKNKNLLIVSFKKYDGTNTIDMNTGIILGKRGKPIKKISHPAYIDETDEIGSYFGSILRNAEPQGYARLLPLADKLFALGIKVYYSDLVEILRLDSKISFTKDFINYLKEKNQSYFSMYMYRRFKMEKSIKEEYRDLAHHIGYDKLNSFKNVKEDINLILAICHKAINIELLPSIMSNSYAISLVETYVSQLYDLKKPLTMPKNFIRELVETAIMWEKNRDEISKEKFKRVYGQYPLAYKLKDNYEIVIPECASDIVNEGNVLNHCIKSYIESVENNERYIVFLRKSDKLKTPLVTISLSKSLHIGQTSGQSNNYPSEEENIAIKEYKEYLKTLKT